MKKPLAKTQAGGTVKGLSVVLEGIDSKLITELSVEIAKEISETGHKVILDNALRNPEENVLIANQYLLDIAAAPLSPETVSLLVVIKLRERQRLVRAAKNDGIYSIGNSSWLGDAYYYELRGRNDICKQIMSDCDFMKPDVWLVIDEESGIYNKLAKQAGIKVLSPKLEKSKILNEIRLLMKSAEQNRLLSAVSSHVNHPGHKVIRSFLGVAHGLSVSDTAPLGLSEPLSYYRPENFGKKVLTAYDTILTKILHNHAEVVKGYSKWLATQAVRDKKPFSVDKLKTEASELCRSLLPLSVLLDVETIGEIEELQELVNKSSTDLLPNIDADPPKPEIKLYIHSPRNEFEILESQIFASSEHSTSSIKRLVDELSYEKKSKLLKNCLEEDSNMSNVTYNFDVSCEFRELFDLLKDTSGQVIIQAVSPRNGYDIPETIENAGLADLYQQCFDLSLELFSLLQAAGFETQAQYASLLGHRMRCKLTLNYVQVKKLLKQSKNQGYKALAKDIKQQVSGVHPLVWSL